MQSGRRGARRAWWPWRRSCRALATITPSSCQRFRAGGKTESRCAEARAPQSRPRLCRVHAQERVDWAHSGPRRLKRAERDDRAGDQSPVALVYHWQPRVQHREDQQRVAELRRPVLEPAHREQNADVHHRGAHDPREKSQRLEEAVQRGETADDRERAGHLTRPGVEGTDVDASLGHGATSGGVRGKGWRAVPYPATPYPATPYPTTPYPMTCHPSLYAAPGA